MIDAWLSVPLDDYEGHMSLPTVRQAQLLSDVFAAALAEFRPASVAVPGCSGGNGFERVDPAVTRRVIGIEGNPAYAQRARLRFGHRLPGLEVLVADLDADAVSFAPVDLVWAGLVLEYVDVASFVGRIRGWLKPSGTLVCLSQLPGEHVAPVSPSPYRSVAALGPAMSTVDPGDLRKLAAGCGLRSLGANSVTADGHKHFHVESFRAD